jgi:hypothetical protein
MMLMNFILTDFFEGLDLGRNFGPFGPAPAHFSGVGTRAFLFP